MALERNQFLGTPEFMSAAAGAKRYGLNGGTAATSGTVSKDGYVEREQRAAARRRAIQSRLRNGSQTGNMGAGLGGL